MGIPIFHNGKRQIYKWFYRTLDGTVIGAVSRYQDQAGRKEVVPFFKGTDPHWQAGIDLKPRPLFGLDTLGSHDECVYIVEGEKSAAALQGMGVCALTSLGGCQAADKADWSPLNGYQKVVLWPDNDIPGEHYAMTVYQQLQRLPSPPSVNILRVPGLPSGGDVVDWLQGWQRGWDGYSPIGDDSGTLKEELKDIVASCVPPPAEWNLAILAGSGGGRFGPELPGDIVSRLPPVVPLDLNWLPEPLRPWVSDVSHRMQTPPDFAAITAIVIMGSLIGAGCAIRPKRFDDWDVIPNVWGACIGRPSVVLKSPSMKEPMQLLERLQAEYGERYEGEKLSAEFDGFANKAMLDDVKHQLSKKAKGKGEDRVVDPDDLQKLKADYLALTQSASPEPIRRLFKTNETSIQSMTVLQNQNPRGVLVFRDELTGLLVKWDREDGADERAYFLEGWNGNGSYTDCKIGRGITDAKQLCISVLGGIQPDKLKRYLYQALQGNNDGLMQRLQLAVWPDEPTHWEWIDATPDKQEKERVYGIVKALADLDFQAYGAEQGLHDQRPFFRFDQAAQQRFHAWFTTLQTVKLKGEEHPLMVEHLGKFRSLMPSLALIFHLVEVADDKTQGPITDPSAQKAIQWCEYLESHARRIYAMAESPEHEAAVRLATKIKAKALTTPFTSKMVYDKGWHGLKNRQEVEAACNLLIDENWLVMERRPVTGGRGRPPLPEYHINPVFL